MAETASLCSSGMLTAQTDDRISERSGHRASTFVAAGAAHAAAMALRGPSRRLDDEQSASSSMATPLGSFSSLPVDEEDFDRMFHRIVRFSAGASGETWLVHMATPASPSIGSSVLNSALQTSDTSFGSSHHRMKGEASQQQQEGPVVEQYAMKVTNFYNRSGGDARRERLRVRAIREIECLQRCQPHPLIVRYVAHRYTDAALELVMELVEGGDLGLQMAARMTPSPTGELQSVNSHYSEAEALFYFVQACVAVRSLHEKGILHRDIKSGNFLCVSNGLLKLADFGFSKDFAPASVMSERVTTEFLGTPAFLAPEVWTGEGYGGKAEVWSLGVMLYQLLTLQLPFGGSTMESLRRRVCAGVFPPIPADRVTVQTRAMVQWMLTVDHERRPTVAQLLETGHMQWTLGQFCALCRRREFLTHDELQLLEQRTCNPM